MSSPYVFSGNPLDRAANRRGDEQWLASLERDESSRFLPLWRLNVLIKKGDPPTLGWARGNIRASMDADVGAILLGLDDGVAHFAVDLSHLPDAEAALGLSGAAEFEDVRTALVRCPGEPWGIVAQARSLVDWHSTHRFCAKCGAKTASESGGGLRRCPACDAEHFPRVNPVVIMLVTRGERCLLGRQQGWPRGMFSALAGFVEAGETVEEAVRREVFEESGVKVGAVRYHSSQPWPFPSSLMIGCMAEAQSEDIVMDDREMEDVRWFERGHVLATLDGNSFAGAEPGRLLLPSSLALAYYLIEAWAR